jgi:hypothetical protein
VDGTALAATFSDPQWQESQAIMEKRGQCASGDIIYNGQVDFYYVPARLVKTWKHAAQVMRKNEVFLEIAGATIAMCLFSPDDIQFVSLSTRWDQFRGTTTDLQDCVASSAMVCHPFKLSTFPLKELVDARFRTSSQIRQSIVTYHPPHMAPIYQNNTTTNN